MGKELVAGIKNAMSRGQSLEQAKASFISAGYNPEEVEEAGRLVSSGGGATEIIGWEDDMANFKKRHKNVPTMPVVNMKKPEIKNPKLNENDPPFDKPKVVKEDQNHPFDRPNESTQKNVESIPVVSNKGPSFVQGGEVKKKSGKKWLLIVGLIIAVLIFLGAIGYLAYVLMSG